MANNTAFHVAEIQRLNAENLYLLSLQTNARARVMDQSDDDQFVKDFKFVWGVTRELIKTVPGLEPKQEVGAQLVININDLPGMAEAMQKPRVSAVEHLTLDMEVKDAPEPRYGASDVGPPALEAPDAEQGPELSALDSGDDLSMIEDALSQLAADLDDFEPDAAEAFD